MADVGPPDDFGPPDVGPPDVGWPGIADAPFPDGTTLSFPAAGFPAAAPSFPAPPPLVEEAEAVWTVVHRLRAIDDTLRFYTADQTLKLALRAVQEDDDGGFECELVLDYDPDDAPHLEHLHTVDVGGYLDEPGDLVLRAWSYGAGEWTPEAAEDVRRAINEAYRYSLCPCGTYVIKDPPARMCVFCQLTARPGEMHRCPVCLEDAPEKHMRRQACCGQRMHPRCLSKSQAVDARCPMCRRKP